MRLDLIPDDLAGKVRELDSYPFESTEAARRFEQLKERLREQLMQQVIDRMTGAMEGMTAADMERMKDMLAALNEMLDRRQRGEDPQFEEFMEQLRRHVPGEPEDTRRAARGDRRTDGGDAGDAQLDDTRAASAAGALSEQLLGDFDLRWQLDQLSSNLSQLFPQMGWNSSYEFSGQDPLGWALRCRRWASWVSSINSRRCCRERRAQPHSPKPTSTACAICSVTMRRGRWSDWLSSPRCSRRRV